MSPSLLASCGYVDRTGVEHRSFDEALDIARRFAAAEPITVLSTLEAEERTMAREAARSEYEHAMGEVNRFRAGYALVRQWAVHDVAVAQREAEIQRLERLCSTRCTCFRGPGAIRTPLACAAP
jgi:hypothetical protein